MRICHDPFESARREWNGVGRDSLQPASGVALVHPTRRHHLLDVHQDRQGVAGFSWGGLAGLAEMGVGPRCRRRFAFHTS